MWGDSPKSHFLQCCAQCLERVGGKERERDSISLSATGESTATVLPPSSPFLSPSVLEPPLPPCLAQTGLGKAGFPLFKSLDNIWMVAGGERGLERRTEGSKHHRKAKEILIASRGIPSLSPAARKPEKSGRHYEETHLAGEVGVRHSPSPESSAGAFLPYSRPLEGGESVRL